MGENKGKTVSPIWRTLCIVIALGVVTLVGLLGYKLFEDPLMISDTETWAATEPTSSGRPTSIVSPARGYASRASTPPIRCARPPVPGFSPVDTRSGPE